MNPESLEILLNRVLELEFNISLPVILLAVLGLLLILKSLGHLRQKRLLSGSFIGLCGAVLLSGGLLALAIALNIHTYQRLTHEVPVASLTFTEISPFHFSVQVENPLNNETSRFQIQGDEWQLDARILRWQPVYQLLGMDTRYRLERLSGRYGDIELERSQPKSAHVLSESTGLDIWSLARKYHQWLPWIDAYYGSATYLPMQDGAKYIVSISQYGLIARSDNREASNAVMNWD